MLSTRARFVGWAAVVAALVVLSPLAGAATDPRFTFTKVADTTTPIPGGGGRFADFAGEWSNTDPIAPSLDHGAAVFLGHGAGFGPDSLYGVFRFDNGVLSRVADNTMPVPGRAARPSPVIRASDSLPSRRRVATAARSRSTPPAPA